MQGKRGHQHVRNAPVEQVVLHRASNYKEKGLVIHVDNRAVANGIDKRTIREASMQVLRRCLLLASQ